MTIDNDLRLEIQNEIWGLTSKMSDGVWIVEHTPKRKAYIYLCDKIDELPELIDVAQFKRFEPELKSALSKRFNKIRNKMREGHFNSLKVDDIMDLIYSVLRRKKR